MTLPSIATSRAVATVVARTRAGVNVSTSPSKTSTSSSTTFSMVRPFDKPPPVRPAVLQSSVTPRVGDGALGASRRPAAGAPEPRRSDDTLKASDSLVAETRALSQTTNVNKSSMSSLSSSSSSSSSLRGRLAPASSSSHSKQADQN